MTLCPPAKCRLTPYLSIRTRTRGCFSDPSVPDQATQSPDQVTSCEVLLWEGAPTEVHTDSQDSAQTQSDCKLKCFSARGEIPHFSLKNTQQSFISLPAGWNNILNAKIYMQTPINVFHYSLCKTTFQPKHSINVIKLLPGGII